MTTKIFTSIFFILLSTLCINAQTNVVRHRLNGRIVDDKTEAPIAKCSIKIEEFNRTVFSNAKGEFLFNMPQASYTLVFDEFPYEYFEIKINLQSDTSIVVRLNTLPGQRRLQEVEVLANKLFTQEASSINKIESAQLLSLPAMVGERDILKALSLNAGVSSSGEGAADVQVRGGTHGQNLFMLDNVPLYSTQHMFGMVSVYNPSIIKSAALYKAGFPAEYGGRVASVIDVRTKDANLEKFGGDFEISIPATKTSFNIPIIKNKLGFNLAARISNYSLSHLIPKSKSSTMSDFRLGFSDINANLLYLPSKDDEIKLMLFRTNDNMTISDNYISNHNSTKNANNQTILALNWSRKLSEITSNNLHFYADGYSLLFKKQSEYFSGSNTKPETDKMQSNSNIYSLGFENKLSKQHTSIFNSTLGISFKSFFFSPFNTNNNDVSNNKVVKYKTHFETNAYYQAKYAISNGHNFDLGLRLSSFGNAEKWHYSLEPRLAYNANFDNNFSVSTSASRMSQNIHRVANPGLGLPMELFHATDSYLSPQSSWIYALGFAKDIKSGKNLLTFKTDFWYKEMNNLVEFKDGFDALSIVLQRNLIVNNSSDYLTQGKGNAYGVDVSAVYAFNKFKTSVDYTLMQARNVFTELNEGKWFDASTDIRHSLSLVFEYQIKREWSVTVNWQLQTGRPLTLPTAIMPANEIDFENAKVDILRDIQETYNPFQFVETERNNFRARAFHKLDIAFNRTYMIRKKYHAKLSFGVYNVYNRHNPAFYFVGNEKVNGIYYPKLKSMSLFPILPSITWGVKF